MQRFTSATQEAVQESAASVTQVPSTDHTLIAGSIRESWLPAAIGGGVIWTFGPDELELAGGTADAFTLTLPGGSDAIISFYFECDKSIFC